MPAAPECERSCDHLPTSWLGRAAGPEGAVTTAGSDPCVEAFGPDDLCRFGKPAMHPGRLVGQLRRDLRPSGGSNGKGTSSSEAWLKGLRVTALGPVGEPEIDQLGARGPSTLPRHRGKSTVLYGQLIDPELVMQRNVSRRRCGLGRLEVDDPDPAVGLPLDPIGTARQLDPLGCRDRPRRRTAPRCPAVRGAAAPPARSRNARGRTRPPPARQLIASWRRSRADPIPTRDDRRARRGQRRLCAPCSASTCTTEPKLAAADRADSP